MNFVLLFLIGIVSCFGVCGIPCGPLVVSYLALTSSDYKQRLIKLVGFFVPKFMVQLAICILLFFFGRFILNLLGPFRYAIFVVLGLFLIFIGLMLILKREKVLCEFFPQSLFVKKEFEHHMLGALLGFFPCLPRYGVFSYIALNSDVLSETLSAAIVYNSGEFISLFLLLNVFHILLTKYLSSKIRVYITKILGVFLVLLGGTSLYIGLK